jgi:hypothetical protein
VIDTCHSFLIVLLRSIEVHNTVVNYYIKFMILYHILDLRHQILIR